MSRRGKLEAPQGPLAAATAWFKKLGWRPFPFQLETWSAYRAGESGLIHASTGTGKTYAAFFGPVLDALAEEQGAKPPPIRVLWLTPLRALSADTALALQAPLAHLGLKWDVGLRTSDTKASVRAKQRLRLPSVLITTPESLSLLLTHEETREKFSGLRAVIVDEWHELLASKRGVLTELALARLRTWHPDLRVWGLSATLGNIDVAAAALLGIDGKPRIIEGHIAKSTIIDSILPPVVERFPWAGHLGQSLLPQVISAIDEGHTALVFTNTRSQTELWYQMILTAKPEWAGQMALHHGSLDRRVRDFVEKELRAGNLRCVVCTSSLDLGVDFTPVDRVVQIGSPKGVARLLQRAGRSGHQPGGVSRVTCVPTNALELIEAAATREAAAAGAIEAREPYCKPLDVLAQHAISSALAGGFRSDELFREVRTCYAYRDLSADEWAWVLDFIVRGGETLKAYPDFRRVVEEDGVHRVLDRKIAARHRMSIGAIVSDASVQVRFLRGGRLGTVEESFVARMQPGDRFTFAGRLLELVRVHELTAWVKKTTRKSNTVPRWMGGRLPLSSELAAAFREQLDRARYGRFESPEMLAVRPILELQAAWSKIPAPDELLIEQLESREGFHLFCYPFEGRLAHEGLAALIAYRLSLLRPTSLTMAVNDYGFELLSPETLEVDVEQFAQLLRPENLIDDILASLNAAELAKRQFREVAHVAGLITQGYPGAAKSNRQLQASSSLFYEVFREHDPRNLLLHQAHREVLDRQFEHTRLYRALVRLSGCRLTWTPIARPSPLAFPLMVDRLRATVSSESLTDRIKRMTIDLERAAGS